MLQYICALNHIEDDKDICPGMFQSCCLLLTLGAWVIGQGWRAKVGSAAPDVGSGKLGVRHGGGRKSTILQ